MTRRAFTLVEVLVALAIFAISAVVLGSSYLNLLQLQAAVRARDTAPDDLHWAKAALLAEPDRALAERGGDVVLPDDRRAIWRSTITPTAVSDLYDVTMEVEAPPPGGSGEQVRATVTLRLLRPTWSTEAERNQIRQQAKQRLEGERRSL